MVWAGILCSRLLSQEPALIFFTDGTDYSLSQAEKLLRQIAKAVRTGGRVRVRET